MATMPAGHDPQQDVLPAFRHISRTWNEAHGVFAARLLPGEFYVTCGDELITTVLGSCVSACIRDPGTGVGGMNHFMLPGEQSGGTDSCWAGLDNLLTRYGVAAMESLINEILKQGATRCKLEVKLFGGASIFASGSTNVGERNVDFVRDFMQTERIQIVSEDLGGAHPRKINYFPRTGRVMLKRLRVAQSAAVIDSERHYERRIGKEEQTGEVYLFD